MPDALAGLISLDAILALPWYVGVTGLILVVLFLISALWSLLTFRIVKAVTRLVLAAVILVILSQGGEAIVQLIHQNTGIEGDQ